MPGRHTQRQRRQAAHVAASERARGVSPARARSIGWATVAKRNPAVDEIKAHYEAHIREGMARYLWLSAFANWAEGADVVQDADDQVAMTVTSGIEWDEVAPETPPAAVQAAADLVRLFEVGEQLSGATPMTELFELAMTVHQGEVFELLTDDAPMAVTRVLVKVRGKRDWEWKTIALEGDDGAYSIAYEFGSMMAAEALGDGVGWSDDHRVTDARGVDFDPSAPSFECYYDGAHLNWNGVTREREGGQSLHGSEGAPHWQRIGGDEEGDVETLTIGEITVVNPRDRPGARHRHGVHTYILWFGQGQQHLLMAYARSLDDALDECIDWLEDQNIPDIFADADIAEYQQELLASGEAENEEDAYEMATDGVTHGGNHGRMLRDDDWGLRAEDPSPAQINEIGQVAQLREEAQQQREYDQRRADLIRPRIWVASISADDAQILLAGRVDDSLRLVPRERAGTPAGGEYGEAAFGRTTADVDLDYVIAYLLAQGPLEPRWNTGHLAGAFVPRTWYLGPDIEGTRRTFVLENFTHEQQRAIYDAVAAALRQAGPVAPTRRRFEDSDQFRIAISYETVTPGAEDDDQSEVETGWIDEEGVVADDLEDAVRLLRHEGSLEPSSTVFHEGLWYTQSDAVEDYRTGARSRRAFHLRGFSAQQQRLVYDDLKRLKVIR